MRRNRYQYKSDKFSYVLQLTAMVDMFTILLVFLLKSFSSSAVLITPAKDLTLPTSTSVISAKEALRLVVSTKGIYLDETLIAEIKEGKILDVHIDSSDHNFIRPLYNALEKNLIKIDENQKISESSERNPAEEQENKGNVVLQADSKLSYSLLKKVMYTSSLAGFPNLKMATFSKD